MDWEASSKAQSLPFGVCDMDNLILICGVAFNCYCGAVCFTCSGSLGLFGASGLLGLFGCAVWVSWVVGVVRACGLVCI